MKVLSFLVNGGNKTIKFLPFDSFGIRYPVARSRRRRIGLRLSFRLLLALRFVGFVFALILLAVVPAVFLVVNAVVIGRRGGVWRRHGRRHGGGDFIVKHRHELLVVESIKLIPRPGPGSWRRSAAGAAAAFFLQHWHFEECDRIANGPPVGPAPGGGEIEKFVDPRRILVTRRRRRRRCKVIHGWYFLTREFRPIRRHVRDLGRQLCHSTAKWRNRNPKTPLINKLGQREKKKDQIFAEAPWIWGCYKEKKRKRKENLENKCGRLREREAGEEHN